MVRIEVVLGRADQMLEIVASSRDLAGLAEASPRTEKHGVSAVLVHGPLTMEGDRIGIDTQGLSKGSVAFNSGPSGDQSVSGRTNESVKLVCGEKEVPDGALDELVDADCLVAAAGRVVDQAQAVQRPERLCGLRSDIFDRHLAQRVIRTLLDQVDESRWADQNGGGDAVGVEQCDELQHRTGQPDRRKPVGALQGQRQRSRDVEGLIVRQSRCLGQHIREVPSSIRKQGAVVGTAQVSVNEVGHGLGQSQRQVPEAVGKPSELLHRFSGGHEQPKQW
nr:hypothetical protein [Streptomyces afghaniensis]